MAANRLPASWMNALDPAAGARRSRWTAAPAGAPRCPYISRRSRPTSGQTVTVPFSFRRGELPRRWRVPFARNVIPGVHAVDRARGRFLCQRRSRAAGRSTTASEDPAPRVPVVAPLSDTPSRERAAFLIGLRELGWIEGKTIAIEYRSAKWNLELLDDLAEELVRLKVDIILAAGGGAPLIAAKRATSTIPIVMTGSTDPVAQQLVASLGRPGGNVTGMATMLPA